MDSTKFLKGKGFKVTKAGWPDKLIDDRHTFYYVEEKRSWDDRLDRVQIEKADQLVRDGRQVLIMIKVSHGECDEHPKFARVLRADPNGKFYDIGPWREELPPKTEPIERVGMGQRVPRNVQLKIYRYMETHIDNKETICRETGATPEQLEDVLDEYERHWWKTYVGELVEMDDGKFALANIVDTWWTTERKSWRRDYPDYWSLGKMLFLEKYPHMKPVYDKAERQRTERLDC